MRNLVTYKIAKKLEEIGFPQHLSEDFYADGEGLWVEFFDSEEPTFKAGELVSNYYGLPTDGKTISAPTIYQVIKRFIDWNGIYLEIRLFSRGFGFDIINISDRKKLGWSGTVEYVNYEDAAMAGIEFIIDKIINNEKLA